MTIIIVDTIVATTIQYSNYDLAITSQCNNTFHIITNRHKHRLSRKVKPLTTKTPNSEFSTKAKDKSKGNDSYQEPTQAHGSGVVCLRRLQPTGSTNDSGGLAAAAGGRLVDGGANPERRRRNGGGGAKPGDSGGTALPAGGKRRKKKIPGAAAAGARRGRERKKKKRSFFLSLTCTPPEEP